MGGRATGIGGVFIRARDLKQWYVDRLGLQTEDGPIVLRWRECDEDRGALTVFGVFPADTKYFGPSGQGAMINFRVHDLDSLLAALREAGVEVEEKSEKDENGRFAWIADAEGNRVELWEPAEGR